MKELALIMTDSHLRPETIQINRSIYTQARDICIKRNITQIYHLGDLFDSRKAQTQEMLMILDELFTIVTDAGISLDIIPGNHDKTDYQSSDSFLHTYRFHPGVNIHSEPVVVGNIAMCPFYDEKSGLYAEKINGLSASVLLTHVGIDQAVMNGGKAVDSEVKQDLFKNFEKVYVGHYHDYQVLKGGKVTYIGSTYQANFGEDNKKGFKILTSDGSIEHVQSVFPEYKKIVIDMNTATKETILELKKENSDSDDNIRFLFKGDKKKLSGIDKNEFTSLGIDVKTEEFDPEVVDYEEMHVTTFNSDSIMTEWDLFTEEDPENNKKGKEYLEAVLK